MAYRVAQGASPRDAISGVPPVVLSNTRADEAAFKEVTREAGVLQVTGNVENKRLIELLGETLKEVSARRGQTFTGMGMLVYRHGVFSHKNHSDLRPSLPCPEDVLLGTKQCTETLLSMSQAENRLHDGFVLFNDAGRMTHVSQYFSPPIAKSVVPNEGFGGRFRAAQYGSLLEGVIAIGIVEHEGEYFLFSEEDGASNHV